MLGKLMDMSLMHRLVSVHGYCENCRKDYHFWQLWGRPTREEGESRHLNLDCPNQPGNVTWLAKRIGLKAAMDIGIELGFFSLGSDGEVGKHSS